MSIPLAQLIGMFCTLFFLGLLLTIPLYKFDLDKFAKSPVFVKILFWVPIFIIFIGVLYASNPLRLAFLTLIILAATWEVVSKSKSAKFSNSAYYYLGTFSILMLYFCLLEAAYPDNFVILLITLTFATVLADVSAFFFGNYLGKHKLPSWLNNRKSWEGVFGQGVGALFGVLLVNQVLSSTVSIWLFVPIALGSIFGDLLNSYVKRRLDIKDWSNVIPGHGGLIDRLSSIAGSAFLLFYFIKVTGLN